MKTLVTSALFRASHFATRVIERKDGAGLKQSKCQLTRTKARGEAL
jgi:hypothetical protein